MKDNIFERSEILLGTESTEIIASKKVVIFGIGGVGSFVAEALARSGVGEFLLVDDDVVKASNINRQIIALHSTVGKLKVDVMEQRILDINPKAIVKTSKAFFLPDREFNYNLLEYDYIIDAIDTILAKIYLAKLAGENNIPILYVMGAGNKYTSKGFVISDISKTKVCPLAKVMRKELKARRIPKLRVLYSTAPPLVNLGTTGEDGKRLRATTGSLPYVPSVAGLMIAEEVIRDFLKKPDIVSTENA